MMEGLDTASASSSPISQIIKNYSPYLIRYENTYKHIHKNPELSHRESQTASLVCNALSQLKFYVVKRNIGGHGVVAILRNGPGSTVLLRADMDALPIEERTGLRFYASKKRMLDDEGVEQPVMHACGHDVHVVTLLAAAQLLHSARDEWQGTLVLCFQPAEEKPPGAQAMIDDGMYDPQRHAVPIPNVVLGGHVGPSKAGTVQLKSGLFLTASDSMKITFHGKGGHASMPEKSIDPVLMAASFITRVQGVKARETSFNENCIITVSTVHAGSADNVIPSEAEVKVNVRTADKNVRHRILEAIKRVAHAEAEASGAAKEPSFEARASYPVTVNNDRITDTLGDQFKDHFGSSKYQRLTESAQASEDFSILASAVDRPYCYWGYGGIDPDLWDRKHKEGKEGDIPGNHSAYFAPVIEPTIQTGMEALAVAALTYLRQ